MMRRLTAIAVAAVAAAIFVPVAGAVPTLNGIFPLPGKANAIARGPDGNMWVLTESPTDPIARITPDGTVTGFNPADVNTPKGITAGPDGNIWLTQVNQVVKVPPANPAGATAITVGAIDGGGPITTGPDGNLWTTSGAKVIKINPANPAVGAVPFTVITTGQAIVSGTDGLLWVADFGGGKIVSVTTAGVATPYPAGNMPRRVAAGPGGQIAYTDPLADPQRVSLLKSGGTSQPVNTPLADPTGITFAADGAYWIGQFGSNNVGRLTTDGQYTTFGGFPAASGPREIAAGPNNTVWVTTDTTTSVARITGVDPPAANGDGGDTTPPVLSNVSLTNKSFRVGKSATRLSAAKAAIGTTIRYTLSEAASVNIVVDKFLPGRRKGKSCVKPTRALIKKHAKSCKRTKSSGTLKRIGAAGPNSEAFSGRMGKRALSPGNYRLTITATDGVGLASQAQTANFKILKPSK